MKNCIVIFFCVLFLFCFAFCSDDEGLSKTDYYNLSNLPSDDGGIHSSHLLGEANTPYGYYAYQPSGYDDDQDSMYPILIFLHGAGEKGNSLKHPEYLERILVNGPPKMIENGNWAPKYPMLVISPQCHDESWRADKMKKFVEYIIEKYKINERRIYITGLSMGGFGCFNYVGTFGDESHVTAVVPICGGGNTDQAENFKNIPVWAFHGESDATVAPSQSKSMIEAINNINPSEKAKITLYPNLGHNSWTCTYEGTGIGKENKDCDSFTTDIFTWMLKHEKKEPEVN